MAGRLQGASFSNFLGLSGKPGPNIELKPSSHHVGGTGAVVAICIIKINSIAFCAEQYVSHMSGAKASGLKASGLGQQDAFPLLLPASPSYSLQWAFSKEEASVLSGPRITI